MKHVKRQDIAQLSREELLEAVKRSPLEKTIDAQLGRIGLVVTAFFVLGLYSFGVHDIAVLVFAFLFGGLYIALTIHKLVDFRSRHFQHELLWRFGYRDTDRLERDAKTAFDSPQSPDWFVIFQGKALPHGGVVDLVAEIHTSPPNVRITQRRCSFPDFGDEPPFTSEAAERVLTAEECSPLLTELAAFDPAKAGGSRWTVRDGFACSLTVLRRQPRACKRFEFNLADRSGRGEQFGPKFAGMLLAMMKDLAEQPMIIGSCDISGNIEIDTV